LTVTAADLDGDGDSDLIFTFDEDGFNYYENTRTSSNKNLIKFDFKIIPNPASAYLNVVSKEAINFLEIVDLQVKLFFSSFNVKVEVPIHSLQFGNYLLKISDHRGKYGSKIFFKK